MRKQVLRCLTDLATLVNISTKTNDKDYTAQIREIFHKLFLREKLPFANHRPRAEQAFLFVAVFQRQKL